MRLASVWRHPAPPSAVLRRWAEAPAWPPGPPRSHPLCVGPPTPRPIGTGGRRPWCTAEDSPLRWGKAGTGSRPAPQSDGVSSIVVRVRPVAPAEGDVPLDIGGDVVFVVHTHMYLLCFAAYQDISLAGRKA